MAIVFISPQRKRQKLFWIIFLFVMILLTAILLIAFPYEAVVPVVPNDSELLPLEVDLDILDSDEVERLESFSPLKDDGQNVGRNEPFSPY